MPAVCDSGKCTGECQCTAMKCGVCQSLCVHSESYKCTECGHYKLDHKRVFKADYPGSSTAPTPDPVPAAPAAAAVVTAVPSGEAKRQCKECNTLFFNKEKFCVKCGGTVVKIKVDAARVVSATAGKKLCASCKKLVDATCKFCIFCGQSTAAAKRKPKPAAKASTKATFSVSSQPAAKKPALPSAPVPKRFSLMNQSVSMKKKPEPKKRYSLATPSNSMKQQKNNKNSPLSPTRRTVSRPAKKSFFASAFSKLKTGNKRELTAALAAGPPVPLVFVNNTSVIEGVLEKKAKANRHLWQKRYFILDHEKLQYYKSRADAEAKKDPVRFNLRDIGQVELAKQGKGSKEGKRINLSCGYRKLELMALDGETALTWEKHLQNLSTTATGQDVKLADQLLQQEAAAKKAEQDKREYEARIKSLEDSKKSAILNTEEERLAIQAKYEAKMSALRAEEEAKRQRQHESDVKKAALEKLQLEADIRAQVESEVKAQAAEKEAALRAKESRLQAQMLEREAAFQKEREEQVQRAAELQAALTEQQQQNSTASNNAEMDAKFRELEENLRIEREKEAVYTALDAERKRQLSNEQQIKDVRSQGADVVLMLKQELDQECETTIAEFRAKNVQASADASLFYKSELTRKAAELMESVVDADERQEAVATLHREYEAQTEALVAESNEQEFRIKLSIKNKFKQDVMFVQQEVEKRSHNVMQELLDAEKQLQAESKAECEACTAQLQVLDPSAEQYNGVSLQLRIATAVLDLRVEYRKQNQEILESRRVMEQAHTEQLAEMEGKLQEEQKELAALRQESAKRKQEASRTFVIFLQGNKSPAGSIDVEKVGELTLADLRQRINAELDDVASVEYTFVIKEVPIGLRQEEKKLLARLPEGIPIHIDTSATPPAPPPPPGGLVPQAPQLHALQIPKSSGGGSKAPVNDGKSMVGDLMLAIRSGGKNLRKAETNKHEPKQAPMGGVGGLMGSLAQALAVRRLNIEDDEDDEFW